MATFWWNRSTVATPTGKPQILYLTNQLPTPPVSGGQYRELMLLEELANNWAIHLACLTAHYDRDVRNAPLMEHLLESITLVDVSTQGDARTAMPSRHFKNIVGRAVRHCRVIHVEGYFLFQYVAPEYLERTVLIAENVEYQLAKHMFGSDSDSARTVRLDEELSWGRAGVLGAVSHEDAATIRGVSGREVAVVPNGLRIIDGESGRTSADDHSVLFVGNYSWPPSADAAEFLISDLWPILAAATSATLTLAGSSPTELMLEAAKQPRILVTGQVPDLRPYMQAATIFLCPLRFGGGTKVKIVEALAAGLPIVASSLSLYGLPAECRSAVLIANSVDEYVSQSIALLRDPGLRVRLGLASASAARSLPTWSESAQELDRLWSAAMENPS